MHAAAILLLGACGLLLLRALSPLMGAPAAQAATPKAFPLRAAASAAALQPHQPVSLTAPPASLSPLSPLTPEAQTAPSLQSAALTGREALPSLATSVVEGGGVALAANTSLPSENNPNSPDSTANSADWIDLGAESVFITSAGGEALYSKNADIALPIASITKLMTALVVLDANQDLQETLTVEREDAQRSGFSRLALGARLTRWQLLRLALMSSENRAAAVLGRTYPGGEAALVAAMNAKATSLGMSRAHFADATGLSSDNRASARDLALLATAAALHAEIRSMTTTKFERVKIGHRFYNFHNSNRLIYRDHWNILLQKTGYLAVAGRCMVMVAELRGRPTVMVFLGARSRSTRARDAEHARAWLTARLTAAQGR